MTVLNPNFHKMYGIYVKTSTASKTRVTLFFQKVRAKHIDNMHRTIENIVSLVGELGFIVFKQEERHSERRAQGVCSATSYAF